MNIQNDSCSHQLWEQRAEDEEVGHIVHVHNTVAPFHLQPRCHEKASQKKLKVRNHIPEHSAAAVPRLVQMDQSNTPNEFPRGLASAPKGNKVNIETST